MSDSKGDQRRRWLAGYDPRAAWQAYRRFNADPDDTEAVFQFYRALQGRSPERFTRRLAATDSGARLLRERSSLLAALSDRDALAALPPGSLGRRYLDFVVAEEISADGLVAASQEGETGEPGSDVRYFMERLRDAHDLWHVLTGYGRDLIGETALLAFSTAQTPDLGGVLIVASGWWHVTDGAASRRLVLEGFRRGRRAAWLPAQPWETLLAQPLEAVRAGLRIDAPPAYAPVYSEGGGAAAGRSAA